MRHLECSRIRALNSVLFHLMELLLEQKHLPEDEIWVYIHQGPTGGCQGHQVRVLHLRDAELGVNESVLMGFER